MDSNKIKETLLYLLDDILLYHLAKWYFLCMYHHRVSSLSLIYQLIKAQCVQFEIEFESSVFACVTCRLKAFKVKISI